MTRIALFDMDGVLADDRHRVAHAIAWRWDEYHSEANVAADTVWAPGKAEVLTRQAEGYEIGYLTGRRSALRRVTENWLDSNGFPFGRLIMREPDWYAKGKLGTTPSWGFQRLAEFKVDRVKALACLPSVTEVLLFEDDPEVVRMVNQETTAHALLKGWNIKHKNLIKMAIA